MANQAIHAAACPLANVDTRLSDCHRLWHAAEKSYFEPDEFRLAIQSAIQTLRSVTFVLQKRKALIPNYEAWYSDWQQRLAKDTLMRWMKKARDSVVHESDLEPQSFVRAEVIASYLDNGPRIEVPARLFDSPAILLRGLSDGPLLKHIDKTGTLSIQRRWIEKSLPEWEMLEALAIAYGRLAELVFDAHRQLNLNPPTIVHDENADSYDLAALGWRMPCMIGHDVPRTLMVSLSDGARLEFRSDKIKIDSDAARKTIERYGADPRKIIGSCHSTNEHLVAGFFDVAKLMFLRDGYHDPFLFLVKDRKVVRMIPAPTQNKREKYLLMRRLANEVTLSGADAAFFVSEFWQADPKDISPYQSAEDSPNRREGLMITLVSRIDEPIHFIAMIIRDGKAVRIERHKHRAWWGFILFCALLQSLGPRYPARVERDGASVVSRYEGHLEN